MGIFCALPLKRFQGPDILTRTNPFFCGQFLGSRKAEKQSSISVIFSGRDTKMRGGVISPEPLRKKKKKNFHQRKNGRKKYMLFISMFVLIRHGTFYC